MRSCLWIERAVAACKRRSLFVRGVSSAPSSLPVLSSFFASIYFQFSGRSRHVRSHAIGEPANLQECHHVWAPSSTLTVRPPRRCLSSRSLLLYFTPPTASIIIQSHKSKHAGMPGQRPCRSAAKVVIMCCALEFLANISQSKQNVHTLSAFVVSGLYIHRVCCPGLLPRIL